MSESKAPVPTDGLIAVLKSSLSGAGGQAYNYLVLYTSFGVVRGRTGLAFSQQLAEDVNHGWTEEVIGLNDVTVEHHSNHLPSASFDRLYVRLSDVRGFALVSPQGQG